jgi:hypothetical protein
MKICPNKCKELVSIRGHLYTVADEHDIPDHAENDDGTADLHEDAGTEDALE